MNIIIDKMPVEIDGIPIYYDFRNMIRFEQLMKEADVWDIQKAIKALGLLYSELPDDIEQGIKSLGWFYRRGEEPQKEEKKTPEAYDFDFDADDINSAFLSVYGIRLPTLPARDLHWWEFYSLLVGLPPDTPIKEKMYYRAVDINKITDKHEKKRAQKLKKAYAIKREKHKYTLEEIERMTIEHYNRIGGE